MDSSNAVKKTSKGKTYYYHREGRGRVRLFSAFGTVEFEEEFRAAHQREKSRPIETVRDLCRYYRRSDKWERLAASTRKTWKPWIRRIEDHFGPLKVKTFENSITISKIVGWRNKWLNQPRAADQGVQVLSVLLGYAILNGVISQHH